MPYTGILKCDSFFFVVFINFFFISELSRKLRFLQIIQIQIWKATNHSVQSVNCDVISRERKSKRKEVTGHINFKLKGIKIKLRFFSSQGSSQPLKNLSFVLEGKKIDKKLKAKIEEMGGKVEDEVKEDTAAVVSDKGKNSNDFFWTRIDFRTFGSIFNFVL